jgi:phytoene dehydrogenase-like protein
MPTDVIVLGAGPNGLTAAALLAKAGRRVLLLERRESVGGLAASHEFVPGYRAPGLLHETACVRRGIVEELDLARHGLAWRNEELPVLLAGEDGRGVLLHVSPAKAASEIRQVSESDAARYEQWRGFLGRVGGFFRRILDDPPPELGRGGGSGILDLARKAIALRRLGTAELHEVIRIAPMCAGDWMNEWFASPLIKAGLAQTALAGAWMGPWSSGTVLTMLLRECTAGPEVHGGAPALVKALEAACRAGGVQVRTGAAVRRIRVVSGAVRGVELEDGGVEEAPVILATCDPRRTFLDLMHPREVPEELASEMRHWRCRGTTAKVHLALEDLPDFRGRPGGRFEAIRTASDLDELERAFDAVKYGELPRRLPLDVRIPTLSDPSLAPPGRHVASILVHCVPYHLRGGWNDDARRVLGDAVVDELARHAPALKPRIAGGEVLSPVDLETRYALTGGHIHHGEHALDQLLSLRPSPACARYRTPVRGLFVGGSGSHPGGGVTCAPGALAAKAVLAARR